MITRIRNSCSFVLFEHHFEIRSDIEGNHFKIKGFTTEEAKIITNYLSMGTEDENIADSLTKLIGGHQKKINSLISFLYKKHLLVNKPLASINPQDTLYDRQIRFLDSFETPQLSGEDFNTKMQARKIVIIGLGAYGSWLMLHCARLGIKHLIGIDFDTVELSNLHRQVLYTREDIGQPKVDACKKMISSVDNDIVYEGFNKKIQNENDLLPFLEGVDLIFNAFGYYSEDKAKDDIPGLIAKAGITAQIPTLCLSTSWLGPFFIPAKSPCYFCAINHPDINHVLIRNNKNIRIEKRAFAPILSTTCSLAILEAVQYLSGIASPKTLGGLININPFQIENSQFISISRNINCKYCSSGQRI